MQAEQLNGCRNRLREALEIDPTFLDLHRRREWFTKIIGDTQTVAHLLPDGTRTQELNRAAENLQVQVSAMTGPRAGDEVAWEQLFSLGRDLARQALEEAPRAPSDDRVSREAA